MRAAQYTAAILLLTGAALVAALAQPVVPVALPVEELAESAGMVRRTLRRLDQKVHEHPRVAVAAGLTAIAALEHMLRKSHKRAEEKKYRAAPKRAKRRLRDARSTGRHLETAPPSEDESILAADSESSDVESRPSVAPSGASPLYEPSSPRSRKWVAAFATPGRRLDSSHALQKVCSDERKAERTERCASSVPEKQRHSRSAPRLTRKARRTPDPEDLYSDDQVFSAARPWGGAVFRIRSSKELRENLQPHSLVDEEVWGIVREDEHGLVTLSRRRNGVLEVARRKLRKDGSVRETRYTGREAEELLRKLETIAQNSHMRLANLSAKDFAAATLVDRSPRARGSPGPRTEIAGGELDSEGLMSAFNSPRPAHTALDGRPITAGLPTTAEFAHHIHFSPEIRVFPRGASSGGSSPQQASDDGPVARRKVSSSGSETIVLGDDPGHKDPAAAKANAELRAPHTAADAKDTHRNTHRREHYSLVKKSRSNDAASLSRQNSPGSRDDDPASFPLAEGDFSFSDLSRIFFEPDAVPKRKRHDSGSSCASTKFSCLGRVSEEAQSEAPPSDMSPCVQRSKVRQPARPHRYIFPAAAAERPRSAGPACRGSAPACSSPLASYAALNADDDGLLPSMLSPMLPPTPPRSDHFTSPPV